MQVDRQAVAFFTARQLGSLTAILTGGMGECGKSAEAIQRPALV
jgi:hypothetical protein